MIDYRSITKVKSGKNILKDVSFTVEEGSTFILFGKSGSGKTTLLRLTIRLEEPTSGDIIIDGTSIYDMSPGELRHKVGIVFQEPRLFPGTVRENINLAPEYHDRDIDAENLAGDLGLTELLDEKASNLSGGEKQRVAIARTLANENKIILMDEPTSSLDRDAILDMEDYILNLKSSSDLTIVFVTHDREQVKRLGNKGAVLKSGVLIKKGEIFDTS